MEVGDVVGAVLRGPFAGSDLGVGSDGRGREEREQGEAGDHDEGVSMEASDCETDAGCVEFLVFHVLLCPDEGVVADVDPAAEREIDVGDGEQHESDEKCEGEDLEGVEAGIC